jgi:hypothetical protein
MYKRLDPEQVEAIYKKLRAYEDTGLEPEELLNLKSGVIPAHWGDLFRAECDGRLVVLPCKVGDVVYELDRRILQVYRIIPPSAAFIMSEIENGVEFYKTREDAEKALEEEPPKGVE